MGLTLCYVAVLAIVSLWILLDGETSRIFSVFGDGFHYGWFESGRRCTYAIQYGWCLLLLCATIGISVWVAWRPSTELARIGAELLFEEAWETRYIVKSIRTIRGLADWSVFETESKSAYLDTICESLAKPI